MKVVIISKNKLIISIGALILMLLVFSYCGKDNINTFLIESPNEPIRNGDPKSNKMAITCNVDWGNEVLSKLLDILEEKNVKITFFITGRWASNNPDLLKLIYAKEHEIGNHAYSHKMHSKINAQQNYDEIYKTEEIIKNILGIDLKYFAPPAGDFSNTTLEVANRLGYKTILWSIDTIDWREDSTAPVIINRVMKKPHQGAILLMHPKPATIEALPYIIDKIRKEGIEIGTVSDLLE
ncbi:polysaccharide deacetylase family protein [Clostridiaceae bacterium 35-E11]